MDKRHENAAWQDKPVPDGMTEPEQAQYIMLRQMYREFRAGTLTQAQGETVKQKIVRFPEGTDDEKGMLLDFFIPRLEGAVEIKLLSRLYFAATGGAWGFIHNTTLEG